MYYNYDIFVCFSQDIALVETDMINGYSQTTLSLSHNSVYNLVASETFSAHLHITSHGVMKSYYTKTCNIGYYGKNDLIGNWSY